MRWDEIRKVAFERSPEYLQILQTYRQSQIQTTLSRRVYLPTIRTTMNLPRKTESMREELFFNPYDSTYLRRWVRDRDERISLSASFTQELPFGPKFIATGYEWKRKYSFSNSPFENEYGTSYTAELRWTLFDGNPTWQTYRIAKYQSEENSAQFAIQIRNFELKLLSELIRLMQAKKQYEITLNDGALADSLLLISTRKYQAGLIPQTDLLQVELSVLERKQAIQTNYYQYEQTLENFLLFLGLSRNESIVWDSIVFPMFDTTATDTIRFESLPEVRIAKARYLQSRNQAYRKRYPLPVQVEGRLFQSWDGRGENRTLANEHLAKTKGGSLELSFTLFDRNEFFLRWEESTLNLREAERNYRKTLLEVEQFVREAQRKYADTKQRVESAEKLVQLSKLRTSISEKRYLSGTISSRDLLEAQQDQMRAELQWLTAFGDWLLSGWTIYWLREQSAKSSTN